MYIICTVHAAAPGRSTGELLRHNAANRSYTVRDFWTVTVDESPPQVEIFHEYIQVADCYRFDDRSVDGVFEIVYENTA